MLNYKSLGFKAGLEIHQQIDSHKLFCKCPSITNKREAPDLTIKRKLRAVAGLSGQKDIAALHEQQKDRTFHYEFYNDCNCLVELDESPAEKLNKEALEIALQLSLLLNAKIVPKIKVMRKIVIDGSNVSGFQRTALIAKDGKIKTSRGIVKIPTIFLEEEAAKKIKVSGKEVTYRLDRLGIPLVEIGTSPDIQDPEHAKETAEIIGTILRAAKVRRGLGTIRQDVNLSIKNSPRMEIKGFQDLKSIPKIIEYEVSRLLKEKTKQPEVRKAEPNLTTSFLRPLPGEARIYPETDVSEIETKHLMKKIKIPELITERSLVLEKQFNLQPELAKEIIEKKINFGSLVKKYPRISPKFIAQIIIEMPKELKTRFNIKYNFTLSEFENALELANDHNLQKEAVSDILIKMANGKKINPEGYRQLSFAEIEQEIKKIFQSNPSLTPNAAMGIIMKKYSGKINPKEVYDFIKKMQ
ncbi:Glu-tRNA(Gln) amidotransferase subunit GatE [Candidatus Woesearchaeota archaeon]|nr:Glu-tRNA(Gln) amidotransferase subunit GatE [Candidatus Woesearchaeota archaeon]